MNRRGLPKRLKRSAVLRCEDIEAALVSLLMEVLNGHAYAADLDKVNALAYQVQRLRCRFEDYPELPDTRETRRIDNQDVRQLLANMKSGFKP